MKAICRICGEDLKFIRGKGWVHSDGNVYKRRLMTPKEIKRFYENFGRYPKEDEKYVDDHCVQPLILRE